MAHRTPIEIESAAKADLLGGLSLSKTAAKYQVSLTLVKNWKRDLLHDQVGQQKKQSVFEIAERVLELTLANITGLIAIARLPDEDREWLAKQNAHDLAIFSGTHHDKLITVINALRAREELQLEPPD